MGLSACRVVLQSHNRYICLSSYFAVTRWVYLSGELFCSHTMGLSACRVVLQSHDSSICQTLNMSVCLSVGRSWCGSVCRLGELSVTRDLNLRNCLKMKYVSFISEHNFFFLLYNNAVDTPVIVIQPPFLPPPKGRKYERKKSRGRLVHPSGIIPRSF